jgi:hypothetical protein
VSDPVKRLKDAAKVIKEDAGWTTPANQAYDIAHNADLLLEFGAAAKGCGISLQTRLRNLPSPMQASPAFSALGALVTAVASGSRKKVMAALSGPDSYGALFLFKQLTDHVARDVTLRPPAIPKPPAPGPSSPGVWVEAGHSYSIPTLRWRLAKCLYGKRSVSEEDVIAFVYPEDDAAEGKLKKLQSDTNSTFRTHKIPYKISRPMTGRLRLERISR